MAHQLGTPAGPRVVIVDVHASDSFREFAAALRRSGVDVVHLRPAYSGRGRGLKRAIDELAGPVVELAAPLDSDDPRAVDQRRRLLAPPTVDVHATEPVLAALSTTPEWAANPHLAKVRPGLRLAEAMDKWDVGHLARSAGVRVPDATLDLHAASFPVVVKGRLGAGGMFVRIVEDEASLEAAVASFRAEGVEPFLETYHAHGNGLGTAGVSRDGRLITCGSFERLTSPDHPLQPAVAIRAFHHEEAEQATARLAESLGYTGIICLNFVPDDDGRPLLIDVNLRVFGAWVTLDELGVPILAAYLELLGAGPAAPRCAVDPSRWRDVARIGEGADRSRRRAAEVTLATSRLVVSRRRTLGWGWVAGTELRVLEQGARGAIRPRSRD
ncbi:MAG: hypothetical protein AB7O74_17295 [Candidatus Nanopelagicales bacterium]